jgi:hypothetical protein
MNVSWVSQLAQAQRLIEELEKRISLQKQTVLTLRTRGADTGLPMRLIVVMEESLVRTKAYAQYIEKRISQQNLSRPIGRARIENPNVREMAHAEAGALQFDSQSLGESQSLTGANGKQLQTRNLPESQTTTPHIETRVTGESLAHANTRAQDIGSHNLGDWQPAKAHAKHGETQILQETLTPRAHTQLIENKTRILPETRTPTKAHTQSIVSRSLASPPAPAKVFDQPSNNQRFGEHTPTMHKKNWVTDDRSSDLDGHRRPSARPIRILIARVGRSRMGTPVVISVLPRSR